MSEQPVKTKKSDIYLIVGLLVIAAILFFVFRQQKNAPTSQKEPPAAAVEEAAAEEPVPEEAAAETPETAKETESEAPAAEAEEAAPAKETAEAPETGDTAAEDHTVPKDGPCAVVYVDGRAVEWYPLDENGVFDINGGTNTIVVEDGKAWMSWADCPDQICKSMGVVEKNNDLIVCLPNRLYVIVEGADQTSELDSVAR